MSAVQVVESRTRSLDQATDEHLLVVARHGDRLRPESVPVNVFRLPSVALPAAEIDCELDRQKLKRLGVSRSTPEAHTDNTIGWRDWVKAGRGVFLGYPIGGPAKAYG